MPGTTAGLRVSTVKYILRAETASRSVSQVFSSVRSTKNNPDSQSRGFPTDTATAEINKANPYRDNGSSLPRQTIPIEVHNVPACRYTEDIFGRAAFSSVLHFLAIEFIRQRALIMPEVRNMQQFFPIALQVTLSADEMIVPAITFDLRQYEPIASHHKAIDLRNNPLLPEDVGHDIAHLWGHGGKAGGVKFRREGFQRRGQSPNVAIVPQYQRLAVGRQFGKRNAFAKMILAPHCGSKARFVHVNLLVMFAVHPHALRVERIGRHADVLEPREAPTSAHWLTIAASEHYSITVWRFAAVIVTANALWQSVRKERLNSLCSFLIHAYTLHYWMLLSTATERILHWKVWPARGTWHPFCLWP